MTTATLSPPAQKREELADKLAAGVAALRDSDEFKRYLDVAARFHSYSFGNQILIGLQRPDASRVAGYNTWRGMGRQVVKGSKAIRIIAPTFFTKRCQCSGSCECKATEAVRFRSVCVFDIAQTDGKPLPEVCSLLTGDGLGLTSALTTIADAEGLTLSRDPGMANGANGYYSRERSLIWVRPDVDDAQAAKTLAHELAHHFAEHTVNGHCREEGEIIAESAAYIVLSHFNLDAAGYTFGYLA